MWLMQIARELRGDLHLDPNDAGVLAHLTHMHFHLEATGSCTLFLLSTCFFLVAKLKELIMKCDKCLVFHNFNLNDN